MSFQQNKTLSLFVLLLLIFSLMLQIFPIFGSGSNHILITEVLYDAPNSDATEEWIELFNPSSVAVSLAGWTISDNVGTFSLSGTIQPGGFLIIAKDSNAFTALYGIATDVSDLNLALGNSGDVLTLRDSSNAEIDMVAWEDEVAGWSISVVDTTIRRIDISDTDSVDDWEASGTLGNPGEGSYVELPPDTIAPIISFLNLAYDSMVFGNVPIRLEVIDDSRISTFEIYVDDQLRSEENSYNWDTWAEENGPYTILAKVKDSAGNWGQSTIALIVNNTDTGSQESGSVPVKIMTYNIERSGINPAWLDVVKEENPDIIVFVETGDWDNNNNQLFNQNINELNTYFSNESPYIGNTGQNIGGSTSGEAIMSRYPILSTVQLADVILDSGSSFDVSHDFMIWELDVNGEIVYVIGSHLKCCGGNSNEVKRERAQEGIINYMDELGDVPIIYAGDMNSFSPFDTGNLAPKGDLNDGPLTMMLDPTDPDYSQYVSEKHTFIDVYRTLNPTTPGYTFGHQNSIYESRIDFIIVNQYFFGELIVSTVGDTASAYSGSDHYTVDVTIEFSGANATINSIPIENPPTTTENISTQDSISSSKDDSSIEMWVIGISILVINIRYSMKKKSAKSYDM